MTRTKLAVFLLVFSQLGLYAARASFPIAAARPVDRPFQPASTVDQALTLIVPADTQMRVELLSAIHSRVSRVDDPIQAKLVETVRVNGQVALPAGSLLEGFITRIQPAGRLRRQGSLAFRFETITLPDGDQEPVTAVLVGFDNPKLVRADVDAEGNVKARRSASWKVFASGFVGLGTFATTRAVVAGATSAATLGPLGGAAVFGLEMLLPRGNDVVLPPNTPLRVRLSYPLTVHTL